MYKGDLEEMGHLVSLSHLGSNTSGTSGHTGDLYHKEKEDDAKSCVQFDRDDYAGQNPNPSVKFLFDFTFDLKELLVYTDDGEHESIGDGVEVSAQVNSSLVSDCGTKELPKD